MHQVKLMMDELVMPLTKKMLSWSCSICWIDVGVKLLPRLIVQPPGL